MANVPYSNFVLENKLEDQFATHLNLAQFCKVDTSLSGVAGMTKKINVYAATNGTEKLTLGKGNTKSIEASVTSKDYEILLAQNHGVWFDEEQMEDPYIGYTITRHAATDMFNTMNADILAEFAKASLEAPLSDNDYFAAFVDAQAMLEVEAVDAGAPMAFALVSPAVLAKMRKALKDDLKYNESFARSGYVGTVAGTPIYVSKAASENEIVFATREACTLFVKAGAEVELYQANNRSDDAANKRRNDLFTRKYYVAALTDATKAVRITLA